MSTVYFFAAMRSADRVARNGLNMRPQPFRCRFTPRSEEIKAAIAREGRQALDDLSVYDGESDRIAEFFQTRKVEP